MPEIMNCKRNNQLLNQGCGICKTCAKFCSPYDVLKYIQPPRAKSIKPVSQYHPPEGSMEDDTVYKKSYFPTDPCSALRLRRAPIIHKDNVEKTTGDFEKDTVTSLSYPGHSCIKPPKPILPVEGNLIGDGKFFNVTTQKHDFVPKCSEKRSLIIPVGGVVGPSGEMEKNTTHKLSYMPINVLLTPPPKPIKPIENHERPDAPMESDTIHKLSFIPCYPTPKETYPWANKKSLYTPNEPMEKETTYKLSFLENCCPRRVTPINPESCLKTLGDGQFYDDQTIYKGSYMEKYGGRPPLIRHTSNIKLPSGPSEKDTVYKMSFPGHCNKSRSMPILPPSSMLRFSGPFEKDTTHQSSFICNYQPKRRPKIPKDSVMRPTGPFEGQTITKLSYIPCKNFQRTKSFVPRSVKSLEPTMKYETTQKTSFVPIWCQPRERPIKPKSNYQRPEAPMCDETVQRMSFMPPGNFVRIEGTCCCDHVRKQKIFEMAYPKAGIVA